MKHTYIKWLLRSKVPIWQVAGLTSTSVATIEKHYGHHVSDDLRSAANAVLAKSAERVPNGKKKAPRRGASEP